MTMNLYYVVAYHWDNNEWWRFAITATSQPDSEQKMREGYSDVNFTRVSAKYICTTTDDVFQEL